MGSETGDDQRRFTRIAFAAGARVTAGAGSHEVGLQDISLNGALLQPPAGWSARLGEEVELVLTLADGVTIRMQCRVAHLEPDRVGLACHHLDVDSATHLRRLIELNLGDESRLHRELGAMIAAH